MSTTRFFNTNVFQRLFKNRKEPLIDSKAPVAKLSPDIISLIREWINDDCLLTLDDISHRLGQQYGISIGQDKIASCLDPLHFSIERLPVHSPYQLDKDAILLLRKVYADNYLEFCNRINLFFIGTTKVNVNTRVYQGKKAVPQWAVKSKTFTISAALSSDGVFCYDIRDSSYKYKESPDNSPERPEPPFKFISFFRKFTKKLEGDGITNANIIMDGPCYQHALEEDTDLVRSVRQAHRIDILPGNSYEFSPLETLFDSLRYHIEKFDPTDPESVFDALKKLPESVNEIECSYYFSDVLNFIQVWSDMRF